MAIRPLSLQDQFLNSARRSRLPVTIFLVKGVKLQGVITWFDSFSLLLRSEGASQLIYKHAVSTIMPSAPLPDLPPAPPASDAGKGQLQDVFLNAATRDAERMTLFLVNGVMLQGEIAAYDLFCMLLRRDGMSQLVYKHAISTVQPLHPLNLMSGEDGEEGE